jgi:hypothetical protein
MSTNHAQSFFPSAQTVIDRALKDIGAVDAEGTLTPTTTQRSDAMEVLNFLVTSWVADGMQVWCNRLQTSLAFTAANPSYTIGNSASSLTPNWTLTRANGAPPEEVVYGYLSDTLTSPAIDIPLRKISREEYYTLSSKASTGTPNCFYFNNTYAADTANYGLDNTKQFIFWPTPDAGAAARYTFNFIYIRPMQDFNALTDTIDFPPSWFNAVRWNLAKELCPSYSVPVMKYDRIVRAAEESKALAMSFDREKVSTFISPAQH